MKIIKLTSIHLSPTRQRQEFEPEALAELMDSIQTHGLFHPPVIRIQDEELILVAGERRLRAIQDLWALGGTLTFNGCEIEEGFVPIVTLGDLSPLEAEEAELDENLRRKDLTWQELASAHKRLHLLRTVQAEVVGKVQTIADTAEEIHGRRDGAYQGAVRTELIVANHLDDPDVSKAKSAQEAMKILKKKEESRRNIQLASEVSKTLTAASHTLENADCISWMSEQPAETFDLIITDPPYGMDAQAFGDSAGNAINFDHQYDDSYEAWRKLMIAFARESFRICKAEAHMYVCCDIDNFVELKSLLKAEGWYPFRTPIINVKTGQSGRVPLPEHGPRRQYEIILFAIKGKKRVTHIYPDVMNTTLEQGSPHGASKPIEMYTNLLQRSCRPGDKILDPFCGSGPIFPAAHNMKCFATGIELNPEYFALSMKRLQSIARGDQP